MFRKLLGKMTPVGRLYTPIEFRRKAILSMSPNMPHWRLQDTKECVAQVQVARKHWVEFRMSFNLEGHRVLTAHHIKPGETWGSLVHEYIGGGVGISTLDITMLASHAMSDLGLFKPEV